MALYNPVYAFMVPFLFIVTVPLAIFAGITTTCAFFVLAFRVIVVYLDIALSIVPRSLVGRKPRHLRYAGHTNGLSSRPSSARSDSPSPHMNTYRRRRRRPSSVSLISAGSTTPVGEGALGLMPSVGPERDFEGLGGWRIGDGDDEIWTTINSRLELPDRQFGRNHHRSASGGGPVTPGEGSYLMMKGRTRSPDARVTKSSVSPNSSRARTPTGPRGLGGAGVSDGYFPLTGSPKAVKKQSMQAAV